MAIAHKIFLLCLLHLHAFHWLLSNTLLNTSCFFRTNSLITVLFLSLKAHKTNTKWINTGLLYVLKFRAMTRLSTNSLTKRAMKRWAFEEKVAIPTDLPSCQKIIINWQPASSTWYQFPLLQRQSLRADFNYFTSSSTVKSSNMMQLAKVLSKLFINECLLSSHCHFLSSLYLSVILLIIKLFVASVHDKVKQFLGNVPSDIGILYLQGHMRICWRHHEKKKKCDWLRAKKKTWCLQQARKGSPINFNSMSEFSVPINGKSIKINKHYLGHD